VGVKSRWSVKLEPWLCAWRAFVLGFAMPVSEEIGVVGRQSQACPSSLSPRVAKYKAMLAALFACCVRSRTLTVSVFRELQAALIVVGVESRRSVGSCRSSSRGEPCNRPGNALILQEQGVTRLSPCLGGGCGLRPNVKI
jgi:hypothetical protein